MNSEFDILRQSPHDQTSTDNLEQGAVLGVDDSEPVKWVPSRFNVRATGDDGSLILWNTYRGSMSVFEPDGRSEIEELLRRQGFEGRKEGVVRYLADRGFLVEENTDEYRRLQLEFGQRHYRTDTLQLILLASEDCNFRCTYCYESFARGTMQVRVRTAIKKLIQKRLSGLRRLSVGWFGGEPLYGFSAIEDLAPFFYDIAQEHSLWFTSHMTTNGYLLTPNVAEKLLSWRILKYQITIDGPPDHHDRSRPTRHGQGTFSTIFGNLKALAQRPDRYLVDLRVNFDKNNYPHLVSFLDYFAAELGGDTRFRLRFRAVGDWGGIHHEKPDVCGPDQSRQYRLHLKNEATKRGLRVTDDDNLGRLGGLGSQVCYAARPFNLIIGATGNLMKCTVELERNIHNVVGKINDSGELLLDKDRLALWTEPAFENDHQCRKCVLLPMCQGIYCPSNRINKKSSCSLLRSTLKEELCGTWQAARTSARAVRVRGGQPQTSDNKLPSQSPERRGGYLEPSLDSGG